MFRSTHIFNPVIGFNYEQKFHAMSVSEAVRKLVNNDVKDEDLPSN